MDEVWLKFPDTETEAHVTLTAKGFRVKYLNAIQDFDTLSEAYDWLQDEGFDYDRNDWKEN